MKHLGWNFAIIILVTACNSMPEHHPKRDFAGDARTVAEQWMMAEDSMIITLPAGHFLFNRSLILEGVKYVTVVGAGEKQTVLSFKNQQNGAEGILVKNCENITLKNFTIEDAPGDNIKVTDTKGITFQNITCGWTGKVSAKNGAYGLYPVLCEDVLIENCTVFGASDAGIYVGQSERVVIRNNKAYHNVAGIESENSSFVKIYGNEAYDNTGGLLIFDLPGLTRYGHDVEAYNNKLTNNNLVNFAPKGNIVAMVPKGTGAMILATRNVHLYNNEIIDNKTVTIAIISYELVEALSGSHAGEESTVGSTQTINENYTLDTLYNPYPGNVLIENNTLKNKYKITDTGSDFGKLFLYKFGFSRPQVIWDGIRSKEYYTTTGAVNPDYQICVKDDVAYADLDLGNNMKNIKENSDEMQCK